MRGPTRRLTRVPAFPVILRYCLDIARDHELARGKAAFLYVIAVLAVAGAVWWYGLGRALDETARRGASDLSLAADRLVGQLQRYRELGVVLADDPRFRDDAFLSGDLHGILLRAADLAAALDLVLLDTERRVIAHAEGPPPRAWLGEDFVDRARQGTVGTYHTVSRRFDRRAFYIGVPVFSADGPVAKVLVVIVDLERIEADSRGATPAVLFTDRLGVTFFSNRSELLLMQRGEGLWDETANYSDVPLIPFLDHRARNVGGHDIWTVSGSRYVPRRALHMERDIPVIGFTVEALIDAGPAYRTAALQAAAAAAICLFFGAVILFSTERRRALALANEELEARVEDRTRALSEANAELRREVREREDAEVALKRAQDDLIQVGKLSALGQMSAGISHELNQPLMAIQSFAENGAEFLARGKPEQAGKNLSRIAHLAARMARIIKNLKAFARQESEPASRVDLCAVVRAAVEVSEPRLRREGVALDLTLPPDAVWVNGGEVRLQQVALNLMSNALDAMAGRVEKRIGLAVSGGSMPQLVVRDTGPGIEDPERLFEPFYSTKTVGDGEGTGLGLSISYGLVQSFGGNISGEKRG